MVTLIFHEDNLFGFSRHKIQVTAKHYSFSRHIRFMSLSHPFSTCSSMVISILGGQVENEVGPPLISQPMR